MTPRRLDPEAAIAQEPTLDELKRRHILRILAEERFRVGPAAARLGISRSSLYARLKAMGLDLAARRRGP